MQHVVDWTQALALTLGGPGLFAVALVDASVLTLPELVDVLVMLMTLQHRELVVYYALAAAAGSTVGSLSVFYLGKKGGEALLRKRFAAARVERTLSQFRRWGMATILVPALLPPPTPFKLLCLAAGATGMTPRTFAVACGVGRFVRYLAEGLLAYYTGRMALAYLARHGRTVGWWLLGATVVAAAVYFWRLQRQRAEV